MVGHWISTTGAVHCARLTDDAAAPSTGSEAHRRSTCSEKTDAGELFANLVLESTQIPNSEKATNNKIEDASVDRGSRIRDTRSKTLMN